MRSIVAWSTHLAGQPSQWIRIRSGIYLLTGRVRSAAQWARLDDSPALARHDQLVGRNILEGFHGTLQPANCYVGSGRGAEAEVNATITLGYVISAAAH